MTGAFLLFALVILKPHNLKPGEGFVQEFGRVEQLGTRRAATAIGKLCRGEAMQQEQATRSEGALHAGEDRGSERRLGKYRESTSAVAGTMSVRNTMA